MDTTHTARFAAQFAASADDDVDEDFLSQIAAAEAQALANKRRRMTTTPSQNAVVSASPRATSSLAGDDDLYTAALKGSIPEPPRGRGRVAGGGVVAGNDGVSSGEACFKCGKSGHWARDCDGGGGGYNGNFGGDSSVPQKPCPCGTGTCNVLTANTEKNRGRKFYKCPLRQENGGCGFFEWCDNASGGNASYSIGGTGSPSFTMNQSYASDASFPAPEFESPNSISYPEKSCPCGSGTCTVLTANTEKNRGRKFYKCPLRQENGGCGFFEWCDSASASGATSMAGAGSGSFSRAPNTVSDSSFPALECPCRAGQCLILTAKTGNNIGSQFYRCPGNEGSSCGFFKWCNEHTVAAAGVQRVSAKVTYNSCEVNNQVGYGVRTGSSCYKCGKEGHWARDCSVPSNNADPVEFGGRSASTSNCYKCNKPGHWARDCPSG